MPIEFHLELDSFEIKMIRTLVSEKIVKLIEQKEEQKNVIMLNDYIERLEYILEKIEVELLIQRPYQISLDDFFN